MTAPAAVGSEAPNFDLTSTEGVVLMLQDEVPRSGIVLYLFAGEADADAEADLRALATCRDALAPRSARVLALSALPLEQLCTLQSRLGLGFPLLHDDRGFLAAYGVGGEGAPRALALVDRERRLRWLARPLASVAASLPELLAELKRLPPSTSNYPRTIVNRFVERLRG